MSALPRLQRLADHIGAAVDFPPKAMAQEIKAALREATAAPDWLPPQRRRANHERYARHLLYGDPGGRFSILAIVWDHGQASPIHAHDTWCAVGVCHGVLTETRYREDGAGGPPVPIGTARRGAGTPSFDPALSAIHRLANESGAIAVSLHVYGVAQEHVASGVNRVYQTA